MLRLTETIEVIPDAALDARGHTAVDMRVLTKDLREYARSTDVAPGFPESPLTKEEHLRRFSACLEFADRPIPAERATAIIDFVARLDESEDVRGLVPLLLEA